MKKRSVFFFSLVLISGIVFGLALAVRFDLFSSLKAEGTVVPAVVTIGSSASVPPAPEAGLENAVINVANTAGKAVVSISIEHTQKIKGGKQFYFNQPFGGGQSPFGNDDNMRKFFDDFFGGMPDREFTQRGLGSGVIINKAGYILTNQHVIDEADKINVTLSDGREFKGEIKGQDQRSDLAVIKINAQNLPVANLGDSDNVKIGQWVVAIGNPYGYVMQNPEPTVTQGVISAMHRSLGRAVAQDRDYNDLIQTDAAINPGNSGGPLVNLKGEVIGINVAIFSTSGGYQGIGFAIPSNNAKRILEKLIEGKKIVYGWLGITVQDPTEEIAKHLGLADKNGVLVAKVLEDGPAAKASMKEGDVLKQVDNKAINNVRELLNVVGKLEAGRKVKVAVIRDKKSLNLEVTIGERPQGVEETGAGSGDETKVSSWRGLQVQDLSPENIKRFRIEEKKGVLVVDVEQGSAADEAGIIPGEVILEINKQPINNISDYEKATKTLKGNALVRTSRGFFLIKEKSEK